MQELIRDILRRVEAKYRADNDDCQNPCAWIELHADESWTVMVQDDGAFEHMVHFGKGWDTINNLLGELKR